jgi:hypothetical protein
MNLCALQQQRELRDLARLHEWPHEVSWLDSDALAACPEPAVLAGFWLQDDPTAARQVLTARAAAGANTLLVPRLPNLNYAQHVNAPAALEVRHKSFMEVHLEEDRAYSISGQAVIQSPLAHGKWGISEFGQSVVLACRTTEDLGWIIFCTASVCSRTVGVKAEEQLELLGAILKRAAATSVLKASDASVAPTPSTPVDVETLMAERGPVAAPWLLALLAAGDKREEKRVRSAASRLGLILDDSVSLATIPDCPADRLARTMNHHGWGAFVRRFRHFSLE